MLTALGLPGGGMVSVGRTHVRVAPGEMSRPNELELPEDAFANGAVEPGAVIDVQRVVLPAASRVALHIADTEITALPKELVSLPVKAGERYTTSLGRATVTGVDPGPAAIVMASTAILESARPPRRGATSPQGTDGTEPSVMIAGLENELELLTGWLRILTTDTSTTHDPVAGVVVSGPVGSGRSELVRAAAATLGLAVKPIDLRTVTTAERLLTSFERAIKGSPPHTVLYIDRLDPLLEREGGMRHQAAAVTRWLLDTAAQTTGVAVALASTRSSIADDLDARDLLRRTLTIAAPNLERRKALLGAAIGDAHDIDLEVLANASPGFSALDISTAVLDARATNGDGLTTESILGAIRTTPASLGTTSLGSVPSHGFDQVANLAEVKQTLTESVIWQLTDPDRFMRMGIEPPRGLLLYGPPGTGKTFVIRALAHESGAAFFSIKGAELLDKWVGESERGVREVFSRAAAVAPAIIFFDEIDALAPVRGSSTNSVTDSVVAALLTELDGVSGRGDVFVIGATNRMDLIDPALLRPGRLEVHLHLDVPASEARQAFFSMTSVPLSDDVDRADLVARTEGMSFADLDGLMRRAAIIAMRSDRHAATVHREHVDAALGDGD